MTQKKIFSRQKDNAEQISIKLKKKNFSEKRNSAEHVIKAKTMIHLLKYANKNFVKFSSFLFSLKKYVKKKWADLCSADYKFTNVFSEFLTIKSKLF